LTDGRRTKSDDNSSHGLKARWAKNGFPHWYDMTWIFYGRHNVWQIYHCNTVVCILFYIRAFKNTGTRRLDPHFSTKLNFTKLIFFLPKYVFGKEGFRRNTYLRGKINLVKFNFVEKGKSHDKKVIKKFIWKKNENIMN
jgi:hypothetical protein